MAIRVRGTESFQVRVRPFPDQTVPTREAAKALELHLKLKKSLGELHRELPTLFGDELDGHGDRKIASGSGAAFVAQNKKPWAALRNVPMPQLRRPLVEDHITRRAKVAPTAARNELQFAKAAVRDAAGRGQQVDLGILEIKPPKLRPEVGKALEWAKAQHLAAEHPARLRRMILLVSTLGLRWQEAMWLEDSMVDFDRGVLTVPAELNKTKVKKHLPLADYEVGLVAEQMMERPGRTPYVFPNMVGGGYSYSGFQKHWVPAKAASGLEGYKFHWLRHTAISLMAREGMKPELIAERVGHLDGGALILRTYRHLFPSEVREAVGLIDRMVCGQKVVTAA